MGGACVAASLPPLFFMKTSKIIRSGNWCPLYRPLAKALGAPAAWLFAELCEFSATVEAEENGWFYLVQERITNKTGIKRRTTESALEALAAVNLVEISLMGMPARRHFRINEDPQALSNACCFDACGLDENANQVCTKRTNKNARNVQTRLDESDKQECTKRTNKIKTLKNKDFNKQDSNKQDSASADDAVEFEEILETPTPQSRPAKKTRANDTTRVSGKGNLANAKKSATEQTAAELLEILNQMAGKAFRPVAGNLNPIISALNRGELREDIEAAISYKSAEWGKNPEMHRHLNPTTLCRPANLPRYIDEARTEKMKLTGAMPDLKRIQRAASWARAAQNFNKEPF